MAERPGKTATDTGEVTVQQVNWGLVRVEETDTSFLPPSEWPWVERSDDESRAIVVNVDRTELEKIVHETGGIVAAAMAADEGDNPDIVWSAAVDLSRQTEGNVEIAFPIDPDRRYTMGTLGSLAATDHFFPAPYAHRADNSGPPQVPGVMIDELGQRFPGVVLLSAPPSA